MPKNVLTFEKISARLRELRYPKVTGIVAILRGGCVPAFLLAHQLGGLPVALLGIRYRDDDNHPLYDHPKLTPLEASLPFKPGSQLLLVDDVSVSGMTMDLARKQLAGFKITTFALKGKADIVAFPDVKGCVHWPWNEA